MTSTRARPHLRSYAESIQGSVTTVFAVSLIVVLACLGAAFDYARLTAAKASFQAAADSAALGAIAAAVEAERTGAVKEGDEHGTEKVIAAAEASAKSIWNNNMIGLSAAPSAPASVSVKKTGSTWTAVVAFDEVVPTSLLGPLGIMSGRVSGESSSTSDIGKNREYWEYSIAVDVSSSMGLGATPAVMSAMLANPKIGCSFACHWDASGKSDTLATAHAAGYQLRIDIVDEAVDAMVATMKSAAVDDNISAGLFGIENSIKKLVAVTTDLQSIADYNIDIEVAAASKGNTNYFASMTALTGQVGKSGDGTSSKSPKKAVFVVTDGVHDTVIPTSNAPTKVSTDHYDGPMDPKFCDKLKENGVKVGVLYIDYYVQSGFGGYISGFQSQMLPNLKACASDGLFFNATSPDGIKQAMNDMLMATFKASDVRLTN